MATGRPLAIIDELLSAVDYLRIAVGDRGDQWHSCAHLINRPGALAALVEGTKSERGTDRDDVAMSLFVQGYAFRIASVAVGVWFLSGGVLDVAPANVAFAMGRGRPNAVNVTVGRVSEGRRPAAEVHAALIDGHLGLLVDAAHGSCRVGLPLLWGNVAASCAASFGALAGALADRRVEVRDRAEEFFGAARAEVREAGRLVRVGHRFVWERRSCCLWYRTASAWLCEDCSLRTAADREARYAALRAEGAQA